MAKATTFPASPGAASARYAANLKIGDRVQLVGRFQSRAYQKQLPDGTALNKVAYEVSVSRLSTVRDEPRRDFHTLPPQMQSPGADRRRDCQGARPDAPTGLLETGSRLFLFSEGPGSCLRGPVFWRANWKQKIGCLSFCMRAQLKRRG